MEREVPNSQRKINISTNFESHLVEAAKSLWWTDFLDMIQQRRDLYINNLISRIDDQRVEDRLRGQIQELNFVLSLGLRGDSLVEKEEHDRRRGDEPKPQTRT